MTTRPSSANGDHPARLACKKCGRELHPGRGDLYVISVLAVADPSPPVFTEEDLASDAGREILRLTALLKDLDAQAAQDQVYRRVIFHLCIQCYHRWIEDPTVSG
jgi:hypothetical protein